MLRLLPIVLILFATAALVPGAWAAEEEDPSLRYDVFIDTRVSPTERAIHTSIVLGTHAALVHEIRLRIDPERHFDFRGDGEISVQEGAVVWNPPPEGGALHYRFQVDHLRDERSYDARCTDRWAIFRGDDLVPPARVRVEAGARSETVMRVRAPEGWSTAAPYPRLKSGMYKVHHPHRGFDRPTGWFALGDLGLAREEIEGVKVSVAGPRKHGVRRLDILAMLRWTLPELHKAAGGDLPVRLNVVGAGDPMWRGGLSGPGSLYVHADRPLISEDGTSPILHELVHTVLGLRAGADGDWVVEGLAEYYSLQLLVRSGTVSKKRHKGVIARQRKRAREPGNASNGQAVGPAQARALLAIRALDATIRERTAKEKSLDDVFAELARRRGDVDTTRFREIAEEVTGLDLDEFFAKYAPAAKPAPSSS